MNSSSGPSASGPFAFGTNPNSAFSQQAREQWEKEQREKEQRKKEQQEKEEKDFEEWHTGKIGSITKLQKEWKGIVRFKRSKLVTIQWTASGITNSLKNQIKSIIKNDTWQLQFKYKFQIKSADPESDDVQLKRSEIEDILLIITLEIENFKLKISGVYLTYNKIGYPGVELVVNFRESDSSIKYEFSLKSVFLV